MIVELKLICPSKPFDGKSITIKVTPEAIMIAKGLHNVSLLDEIYMQILEELPNFLKIK